jgi:ATP-dependent Clp protease ATP-binding subunit ClpX
MNEPVIDELKTGLRGFGGLDPSDMTGRNAGKSEPMLPSPEQIVRHLDRHVIGHDVAKRMLATACYEHLMQCATTDLMGGKVWPDNHCVIAGPSGSGKSLMISTLGDFLGIPVFEIDCSNLSPSGYKGRCLSQIVNEFEEWLVTAGKTKPALVVWEEIDKLRSLGDEAGRYREMAQSDALRFLDGATCGEDGTLDASRILNIGCGAFVGLDRIMNPTAIARIGFETASFGQADQPNCLPVLGLQPDHLVKFGLITEFVGRFSRFAFLDPIDRSAMQGIITGSESSVLKRKVAQFALHGVRLHFDDDAIAAVADMVLAHPTGARGLRLILGQVLSEWEFQLPELAESGVTDILFDERAVRGESHPVVKRSISQYARDSLLQARCKAGSYTSKLSKKERDDLKMR